MWSFKDTLNRKHVGITAGVRREGGVRRERENWRTGMNPWFKQTLSFVSVRIHTVITHLYFATLAGFVNCHSVNLNRVAHWKPSELVTITCDNVVNVTWDKIISHMTRLLGDMTNYIQSVAVVIWHSIFLQQLWYQVAFAPLCISVYSLTACDRKPGTVRYSSPELQH